MNCPSCGSASVVIESTPVRRGYGIRRRRECIRCGSRWTTREEASEVSVRSEIAEKIGARAAGVDFP